MGTKAGTGNVVKLAQFFSEPREVTEVVRELREIHRKTGLERALAIGELVIHRFFGGSADVWHERRKNKNNSARRIAEHPDCPPSRVVLAGRSAVGALRRAVDALSGMDLDASDLSELAELADQVAVLQAEMRFQKGPALTEPCAGPGTVAKVNLNGGVPRD